MAFEHAQLVKHVHICLRRKDAAEYIGLLVQCLMGHKAAAQEKPCAGDVQATVSAMLRSDVLPLMLSNVHKLSFESRKDVVEVFTFTCKHAPKPGSRPGLEYLRQRTHLVRQLVRGYEDTAIALNCGEMVRTAVSRDAALATSVLNSECLQMFFQFVQVRRTAVRMAMCRSQRHCHDCSMSPSCNLSRSTMHPSWHQDSRLDVAVTVFVSSAARQPFLLGTITRAATEAIFTELLIWLHCAAEERAGGERCLQHLQNVACHTQGGHGLLSGAGRQL